jgi:hypothetical protein
VKGSWRRREGDCYSFKSGVSFRDWTVPPRLTHANIFGIQISEELNPKMTAPATDDEAAVVLPIESLSGDCWIQRHHTDNNGGEPISIREWDDEAFRQANGWHGHDLVHSAHSSPVHVHSYRVECKSKQTMKNEFDRKRSRNVFLRMYANISLNNE